PSENLDEKGFSLAGDVGIYFEGQALRGFFLKAYAAYESFTATLTHPDFPDLPPDADSQKRLHTAVFGGTIGSTTIIGPHGGRDGGFILSGGIGIGVATADPVTLRVRSPISSVEDVEATYFDKVGRIRLLGSFALGAVF